MKKITAFFDILIKTVYLRLDFGTFFDRFWRIKEANALKYKRKIVMLSSRVSCCESGIKNEGRVYERVGRLMEKYPSIHKYYHNEYQVEEKKAGKKKPAMRIVTSMP